MSRVAIAAAILACCCLFPVLSFAKVGIGYIDTGARLFELDGKPAVIFKSWYKDDTLAPCDFVFAVSATPDPTGMADWQICPIDQNTQMVSTCFAYNDLAAEVVDGHPTFAQHIWYGGWTEGTDHVRFGYVVSGLPTSERDWQVQTLQKTEWSDCDMAVIGDRPLVALVADLPNPGQKAQGRALRLLWAKSPAPQGIDSWDAFDLAPVGKTSGLAVVECAGKPTVFFLGGRDPKVVNWDMYIAQLDPTSSKWAVVRLPNTLRPWQDLWSAKVIRGQVFFAFFQGDWLKLAQADESQVLDPAGWRVSQLDNDIVLCKPELTSLNGLPAIAYVGREGITLVRAKALAPQDQNDWTLTSLHFFSEDFSFAEIAGKPAISYIEHGERSGALRYAYLFSESPGTAEKWHASTIFAGWKERPGSPSRTAAADPLKSVVINTSSNARTIPLTSPLRDPARYFRLLVLNLSILVILVVVIAVVAVYRRRRHHAA